MPLKISDELIKEEKNKYLIIDLKKSKTKFDTICNRIKLKLQKEPIKNPESYEVIENNNLNIYIHKHINSFLHYNDLYVYTQKKLFFKVLKVKCDKEISAFR